ncbi:MAG: DUF134 domain-containing protein [Bacteroidota bacterium]|nr:DUF134 domain-containing protein [Bacteroidota bacterium]
MPRHKRMRRISQTPSHRGFKAIFDDEKTSKATNVIQLHLEEYESIKLMDYELYSQEEAASFMHVSRPTITRIYESARRKIAKALIEGISIEIRGGKFETDDSWVTCEHCQARYLKSDITQYCPWCGSENSNLMEDNL